MKKILANPFSYRRRKNDGEFAPTRNDSAVSIPITKIQHPTQSRIDNGPLLGLKLLHLGEDPEIDIVAVHGLDGHCEKTWTCGTNGKLWLRDFLPNKIPRSRIWSWGYDSRTHSKNHRDRLTTKKLYEHGSDLVHDLDSERRESKTHQRPIIFVAHSLGGIVVKIALLHSDRARKGHLEEQRSIKLSTYGIIFMGTPHQGGQGVSIGKILLNLGKMRGNTSDGLVKHLEKHSELLQQQLAEFNSISRDLDIKFAYETKPYQVVGGAAIEIVPKWSAVVPGTPDAAEFGIDDDHKGMTKFSNEEDQGYKKLSRTLLFMTEKAGSKVERNWIEEERKNNDMLDAQIYTVQFSRQGVPLMSKYVPRNTQMMEMKQILLPGTKNTERRSLVLHGLGGIGKTQLSLAYATEHKSSYTAIFWLDGQTRESLKRSIASIARRLPPNQIPELARSFGKPNSGDLEKVVRDVLDWFGKPENTEWLLIYDNVDRDDSLEPPDPDSYDIDQYLPSIDQGSVIITTRRFQLRNYGKGEIEVSGMTPEEGLEVLADRIGLSARDDPDVMSLIEHLGKLPLALAQAGSYMRETATSISEYREAYESTWNELMKEEATYSLREYGPRSVYTTWTISFEYVKQKNEAAARMLQLWTCLNNRDIWYGLLNNEENTDLKRQTNLPEWFNWVISNKLNFQKSVGTLLAYSLIEKKQDLYTKFSYTVHPVVHKWCYEMLNTEEKQNLASLAIRCVGFAVPTQRQKDCWKTQLRLIPHADQCYRLLNGIVENLRNEELTDIYGAFHNLSCLYSDQGKVAEAEEMVVRALKGREKALGLDHTSTLETVNNLGSLYWKAGKLAKAEEAYVRALKGREKTLGLDHTSTLGTVNNLGGMYWKQGKLAEAEEMYIRALKGKESALGLDHASTLNTVNNLGPLYVDQGKLAEAEEMFFRALKGREKTFGLDHTLTLETVNNLGLLYQDQGKLAEAEEMYVRSLKGKEKALGLDHTSMLETVSNLGSLYLKQGKLAEADEAFIRALKGLEKALGLDHITTLNTVNNLGSLYWKQGKLAEAEEMFVRALKGREKSFGLGHKSTSNTAYKLADLYQYQKKYEASMRLFKQAESGYRASLGPQHEETIDAMDRIEMIHKLQKSL